MISLTIPKKAHGINDFFIIYISPLAFPICLLILLISIQVLSNPSTPAATTKLSFPIIKWHKFPINIDPYPLAIPKYVVNSATLFCLKRDISENLLFAINLVFIVSNGYRAKWIQVANVSVVANSCLKLAYFLIIGI